ncbi:MAG TPA: hypothetical protein DCG85_05955 [Lachnospiraceae bacterium]|nr:hypothetical protein [Lachnospiraceae bacterium]
MKDRSEKLFAVACLFMAVLFVLVVALSSRKAGKNEKSDEPSLESAEENTKSGISENDLAGMEDMTGRLVIAYDEKEVIPDPEDMKKSKDELLQRDVFAIWNGSVDDANEVRADAFVEFKVSNPDLSAKDSKDGHIKVEYNDDFYIPEFDSLDAAIRICNAYEVAGYEAEAVKCEDEGLKKAVEPAVRIIFEDNSKLLMFPAIRALAGEM